MSMLAEIYKQLTEEDFRALLAIEAGMKRGREYVPLELVIKLSNTHEEKLSLILGKLHELKLVRKQIIGGTRGYRLTNIGHDMLALRHLVRSNVIEALDGKMGVGKESEIYLGLAPGGIKVAVKVLRIGRTSFRRAAIVRDWGLGPGATWYKISMIAAEREFKALKELYFHKAKVPAPLGYNRHVVVIEYIEGPQLYTRPRLSDPEGALRSIIETLRIAYRECSIVHGDLSEYNVLIRAKDEAPFIIDWPQFVYKDSPAAMDLLRRDVTYISRFFYRVYGVRSIAEELLKNVIE